MKKILSTINKFEFQRMYLFVLVVHPRMLLQGVTNTISRELSSTSNSVSAEIARKHSTSVAWLESSSVTCQQIAPRCVASARNLGLQTDFFLLLNDSIATQNKTDIEDGSTFE